MEFEQLKARLAEAESLLSDARSLLNNIHGYDTDTYRDICRFLNGDEEEEDTCDGCDNVIDDCDCEFCDECNGNLDYNGCTCD